MGRQNKISVGQINLSKRSKISLQEGGPEGSLFKRSLIVYEGEFMGMFGPVKITRDMLQVMVERFNREYANPKNEHDYPPLTVDHNASADNTLGRLVPELVMEEWVNPRNNEKAMAVFADIRVDDEEAKEKVIKGKYSQLSISFDDDMENLGEIFEISFVGVEAARGAQVLNKGEVNMDKLVELQKKLDAAKLKFSALLSRSNENRTVRLASYKSLSKNLEEVSEGTKKAVVDLSETIKSLKTNVIKSQLQSYVREGRLGKAEFDKIDVDQIVKMNSESQKVYFSAFKNRPVSPDLFQHGMNGAKPVGEDGVKVTGAALRKAIKDQKAGKVGQPLANGDDDKEEDKEEMTGDKKKEDMPVQTDLTMEDIEDALSKLEGLSALTEKVKDASCRMNEILSKLEGSDKEEKEEE